MNDLSKYLYYDRDGIQIYCGDCREILPQIDVKVDLVLTDPPYESMRRWEGIGTTARMGMGKKGTSADDPSKFFPTIPNKDLMELTYQFSELLKDNRHCYIMCDEFTLPSFYTLMRLGYNCCDIAGNPCQNDYPPPFDHLKTLVWDKITNGMGYHYRCRYELVLMFDKGKNRRLADLGVPDILQYKRVEGKAQHTPTEKPIGLFECLVAQSTEPGELVLDPFQGAGTTLIAATHLKRRYIGIEIEERYCAIAVQRLSQEVMRLGR